MGFLGNVKNVLFGAAYEDDYEDDYAPEDTAQENTASGAKTETEKNTTKAFDRVQSSERTETKRDRSKVVNFQDSAKLNVVLVKPERYEEVAEIANHLREKHTIVLNLEKANREVARRILDFLSGVAHKKPSVLHYCNSVGERLRLFHIMSGENYSYLATKCTDYIPELTAGNYVKTERRLVKK